MNNHISHINKNVVLWTPLFCVSLRFPIHIVPCFFYCKQNKIKFTLIKRRFTAVKPTKFAYHLEVAYLDFIQFEKSSMSYLPLLENRKKIE